MGRSARDLSSPVHLRRTFALLAGLAVLAAARPEARAAPPAILRGLEPGAAAVTVELEGAARVRSGRLAAKGARGPRLYFDFAPAVLGAGLPAARPAPHPEVRELRLGQFDARTARVVLELEPGADPEGFATWTGASIELRRAARVASLVLSPGEEVDLDAIAADLREELDGARPKAAPAVPEARRRPRLTVVIDPGHGGRDTGALGVRGTREKDVTLKISKQLARVLVERGFEVVLTRSDDRYLSLDARVARAHAVDADLVISVHANAHEDAHVHGVETFHAGAGASADSRRLARLAQGRLVRKLRARRAELRDLGVKRARFFVLRNTRMPAVLVETGFITHPREGAALSTPAYRGAVARALADAVEGFAGPPPRAPEALALREIGR